MALPPLPLEDWIVPVHYLRSTISFAGLKRAEAPAGKLSLNTMLDEMRGARDDARARGQASPRRGVADVVKD